MPTSPAGHLIKKVEINNIALAGQDGFTKWIVEKTATKSFFFFDVDIFRYKTKLFFFET